MCVSCLDPTVVTLERPEVATAALSTGAHMHVCHVNSTSLRHVDAVHDIIGHGNDQGLRITTEAYSLWSGLHRHRSRFSGARSAQP